MEFFAFTKIRAVIYGFPRMRKPCMRYTVGKGQQRASKPCLKGMIFLCMKIESLRLFVKINRGICGSASARAWCCVFKTGSLNSLLKKTVFRKAGSRTYWLTAGDACGLLRPSEGPRASIIRMTNGRKLFHTIKPAD